MSYNFSEFKNKISEIKEWLRGELSVLQTGRANPALVDRIHVESYGSKQPISNIASIGVEDARTIKISPWDKSQIDAIEKAIVKADIGVSTSSDEGGVRINIPELTSEKRKMLIKTAGDKLEEARVSLRRERDDIWSDIQDREQKGEISEDEKFRLKDEMQELVDEANDDLEELVSKKEKDIKGE